MSTYKKICITDRHLAGGDLTGRVDAACRKDADMVILRAKDLTPPQYTALASEIIDICSVHEKLCVLHTFIGAARELNHPYIHLAMEDFKALSSEDRDFFDTVGVSTHSVEEAVAAEKGGASYITASHIFSTQCKEGLDPRGLSYLKEVCGLVDIPVFALGGITDRNAELCIGAGATGICMMSGYMNI